jgi:hypothetical protein
MPKPTLPPVAGGAASRARAPERDEAYSPLEASDTLPVVSLALFGLALAARPLVRLLPRELRPYPWGVVLPVAFALLTATLGALLAAASLRLPRRRGLARLALLLNVTVLALTALTLLAMFWIIRR